MLTMLRVRASSGVLFIVIQNANPKARVPAHWCGVNKYVLNIHWDSYQCSLTRGVQRA